MPASWSAKRRVIERGIPAGGRHRPVRPEWQEAPQRRSVRLEHLGKLLRATGGGVNVLRRTEQRGRVEADEAGADAAIPHLHETNVSTAPSRAEYEISTPIVASLNEILPASFLSAYPSHSLIARSIDCSVNTTVTTAVIALRIVTTVGPTAAEHHAATGDRRHHLAQGFALFGLVSGVGVIVHVAVFQFLQDNGWGNGVFGVGPTRLIHDSIGFVVALISNDFLNVTYIWRRRPEEEPGMHPPPSRGRSQTTSISATIRLIRSTKSRATSTGGP